MKVRTNVNLCPELWKFAQDYGKPDERSGSYLINKLLKEFREKQTKTKKVSLPVIVNNIPDNLNVLAWETWVDFRKAANFKKYKTESTMKKLAKMGTFEDQMLIVQQSVENEYQGLFALKNKGQSKIDGNFNTMSEWIDE